MRSFKSSENIHKKEGGSYYVVSANKASSNCNKNVKVKKEFKPNLLVKNKYVYELPKQAKDFYGILIRNFRKRSFNEKYWANQFLDIPYWTRVYESRIQNQKLNKLR